MSGVGYTTVHDEEEGLRDPRGWGVGCDKARPEGGPSGAAGHDRGRVLCYLSSYAFRRSNRMPNSPTRVPRMILNFTGRCNMACPYCYVPFDGSKVDSKTTRSVVKAILAFAPDSITFGGGDPFMFEFFPELLLMASIQGPFIQVDTNAKCLETRHVPLLEEHVDLLGLPLDGSTPDIHGKMRRDSSHFSTVMRWVDRLQDKSVALKVNTVVSKINRHDILSIGNLLTKRKIARWSLYQFWPMADGLVNSELYDISDADFIETTTRVTAECPKLRIECGTVASRSPSYVFVTHDGTAYTVDPRDRRLYIRVGSVFDDKLTTLLEPFVDYTVQGNRIRARIANE